MASHLVTGAGPADTVVIVRAGVQVAPVCAVTSAGVLVTAGTGAPNGELQTGTTPANAVMQVKPGMQVRAVCLVDGTGNFVS